MIRKRAQRWVVSALAAMMIIVALIVTRSAWLPLPARFLEMHDQPTQADIIVVLGGAVPWRAMKAAQLFHEGYAPRVMALAGMDSEFFFEALGERLSDAEVNARILKRRGVPDSAIVTARGARGTYGEAQLFGDYVRRVKSVRSAILVTSGFHARRAKWVFGRVLAADGVRLIAIEAEEPGLRRDEWWRNENGMLAVFNEYLKFAYYIVHY